MGNDETSYIGTHDRGRIRCIVLQRSTKKNAISLAMYQTMADTISEASKDKRIRVVLLTGSDGIFTSGNDLEEFAKASVPPDENHPAFQFMHALANCPKPVVIVVEGLAIGIGTTLLLHADLVYASSDAVFKLPFVNLGLCPEYASSILMPRLMGHAKAAEYLLLGDTFDAHQAERLGMVNAVVEKPMEFALAQCEKLTTLPPAAVRRAKALMKQPAKSDIDTAIKRELQVFIQALGGKEFAEAAAAFFEKRPADFSGFE